MEQSNQQVTQILKIQDQLKAMKHISLFAAVWLNKINKKEILKLNNKKIIIFQSSTDFGGYDSFLSNNILLNGCKIAKYKTISINKLPACGQNDEVLKHHNLSSTKILKVIKDF